MAELLRLGAPAWGFCCFGVQNSIVMTCKCAASGLENGMVRFQPQTRA